MREACLAPVLTYFPPFRLARGIEGAFAHVGERRVAVLLDIVFWWAILVPPAPLGCFLWWRSGRKWVGLAATWALIVGFVGFLIGFFGPLVWSPESKQGPMLGIFFTGPLAFAATATRLLIVGAVKWKGQRHLAAGIAPHAA